MTTLDDSQIHDLADDHGGPYYKSRGTFLVNLIDWATTIDHKKIGVMYLFTVLLMFFLGGMAAIGIRLEHLAPTDIAADGTVTGQFFSFAGSVSEGYSLYNRVMTLHGAIMIFLFIIPGIPASMGNFFLPIMLGAKDVAFPRLNLLSWYLYVIGALVAILAIVFGGIETGWTFYTPYSTTTDSGGHGRVVIIILGVFILGFSSILTGLNFVVTTHKLRAPGMGWFDMPLFIWGLYGAAIIQILATPVIGITLLLLIFERTFGIGVFDPALGGDPVLFQHFFWFYSHPVVDVMILPAMGIISEVITVFSHKRIFGYRAIAFSTLAIAAIGFLVWGHHLFTSEGELVAAIFSGLTFLVAIPSAVKVFNWLATLYKGSIDLKPPMLYALSFLFLFTIGGLTGLPLGTLATDLFLHDTYFVVAHFHYTMMGGTVMAFMAGLLMWWPKMFGKMYSIRWATIAWALVFVGFNITFFTQFILGLGGMPRRYATYLPQFQKLHEISTFGSWLVLAGFLIHLFVFIQSLVGGRKAPRNPWGGLTLEWTTESPPISHNFEHEPIVTHGPYDYDKVVPPHVDPKDYPLPD
jgi:cytochrome c oxidase subunit 1